MERTGRRMATLPVPIPPAPLAIAQGPVMMAAAGGRLAELMASRVR